MLEVLRMSFKFIRLEESILAESTINKKSKMLQLTVCVSVTLQLQELLCGHPAATRAVVN